MSAKARPPGRGQRPTFLSPTLIRPGMRPVDALDPGRDRQRARHKGLASVVVSIVVGLGIGSFLYDVVEMKPPTSAQDQAPAAIVTIETPAGKVVHITQKPGESYDKFAARILAAQQGLEQ